MREFLEPPEEMKCPSCGRTGFGWADGSLCGLIKLAGDRLFSAWPADLSSRPATDVRVAGKPFPTCTSFQGLWWAITAAIGNLPWIWLPAGPARRLGE